MRHAWMFLPLIVASAVHADTVVLAPTKDNTVYADNADFSNGMGEYFFAGANGFAAARRAFIAFDVAGVLPAGATIDSVVLDLNMSRTTSGSTPVALHRVLFDWGEGASNAFLNEGNGINALPGDVTWTYQFFDTLAWPTAGGDFAPAASAVRPVNNTGRYAWRSAGMRDDVQAWLDTPAMNFGWAVLGVEGQAHTAKRFDSLQNLAADNRPRLVIHYTTPPTAIGDRTPALERLLLAAPNPFHDAVTLRFELGETRGITLAVYDVRGRLVRVLAKGTFAAGVHHAGWDGHDASLGAVGSGVYFVRLERDGRTVDSRRILLLR